MLETLIIIFGVLSIACMFAALWLARREVSEAKESEHLCMQIAKAYIDKYTNKVFENADLTQELEKYKRKRDSHGRFVK